MVWIKRLNNSDSGDATHLGGDHWDTNDKYFDDTDIEPTTTKPAKINTKTYFRDGILYILDSTGTFTYRIKAGSLSANVDLSLPALGANGTLLSTGGANDWVALQTFRNSLLKQMNPANSKGYIHVTSAITDNRNVTWPLLLSDDEVLFKSHIATLVGKTLNINTNTIKHETTNTEGDILIYDGASGKYIRLPGGTDGQVLTRVSGDTAWAAAAGGGGASNVLYTDLKATAGFKYGLWYGNNEDGEFGLFSDLNNIGGTANAYIDSTTGYTGLQWAMTSSSANVGWETDDKITIRKLNPDLTVCFQLDEGGDNVGSRVWIGFVDDLGESLATSTFLDSDAGFCFHKASADNFFKITSNDGSGTQVSTASILATDSAIHTIRLVGDEANTRWGYSLDGAALTYINTAADIPNSTVNLGVVVNGSQDDSVSRNFRVFWAKMVMKERV